MKFLSRSVAALVAALALCANFAVAQQYPTTNPSYIPAGVLAATTLTTAGTVVYQVNGQGTVFIRVAGTNSGLSAVAQVSEARSPNTVTWTTVPVSLVGGSSFGTIVTNGLYRVNVSGAAQLRFNLSSITGTNVTVTMSGDPGPQQVSTLPATRKTFFGAFALTPVSSPTDFFTISGSASTTVRVNSVSCSGISTASPGANAVYAIKRSAPTTGGTSSTVTVAMADSNTTPAATATLSTFTANGSVGATAGTVKVGLLGTTSSGLTAAAVPVTWTFGNTPGEEPVVLRGTSQVLALNGNGVSFPASTSLQCSVVFTEE